MPGPLPMPEGEKLRRNAPTIPTTNLPVGGRRGPAPEPPAWMELGLAGLAWWEWAWRTPQACAWSSGDEVLVARRAGLEDRSAAAGVADFDRFFGDIARDENLREVRIIVNQLASLVTGAMTIAREQRELDDRLGLTPRGLAGLRWKIISDEVYYPEDKRKAEPADGDNVAEIGTARARRDRLIEQ